MKPHLLKTVFAFVLLFASARVLAANTILYTNSPFVFTYGTQITQQNPVVTGNNSGNYTVSPALPDGLALSNGTGRITGTPNTTSTITTYTITSHFSNNQGGNITTIISIT